jgi:biotin synthase-related radical SAM superfamily protein
MNPNLPLEIGNIIPQCSWCNRPYRNYFCFDETGRVSAINDPKFIEKSTTEVQRKMFQLLKKKFTDQ